MAPNRKSVPVGLLSVVALRYGIDRFHDTAFFMPCFLLNWNTRTAPLEKRLAHGLMAVHLRLPALENQ